MKMLTTQSENDTPTAVSKNTQQTQATTKGELRRTSCERERRARVLCLSLTFDSLLSGKKEKGRMKEIRGVVVVRRGRGGVRRRRCGMAAAASSSSSSSSSLVGLHFLVFFFFVCCCSCIFDPVNAVDTSNNNSNNENGPMQVGEHHSIHITSNFMDDRSRDTNTIQPLSISDDGQKVIYFITHDDASYIAVHVSKLDLPSTCYLQITNDFGTSKTIYNDKERHNLGQFWARHVPGDAIVIAIVCTSNIEHVIFEIDNYVSGFPINDNDNNDNDDAWDLGEEEGNGRRHLRRHSDSSSYNKNDDTYPFVDTRKNNSQQRSLSNCQADDKENAICYKDDPTYVQEYDKSRAVARLLVQGSYSCTGFLVGPNNQLLTNEHCIESLDDVYNTDFEFDAEEPTCDSTSGDCWLCDTGIYYDGIDLLAVSYEKDYALIQLDGNPIADYGYLDLDNRIAIEGEQIYIPQHSNGHAKELALKDSSENGGTCQVKALTGRTCYFNLQYQDVRYTCDTEGGASGAPVISRMTQKVIAIHHCGDYGSCYGNTGVPTIEFYNEIYDYVYAEEATTSVEPTITLEEDCPLLRETTLVCDIPRTLTTTEKLNLNWTLSSSRRSRR